MYIAMNRFRVRPDQAEAFETMWAEREVYLHTVPGFREFHMLRGPRVEPEGAEPYTLYASHTVWESEAAFSSWTRSEAFRAAHRNAGGHGHLYVGGPQFEGFTAVQAVRRDGTRETFDTD